jgi:hypothetical protein
MMNNPAEITDKDREVQAAIWSLLLMVAELALGLRTLRNSLHEKKILGDEDEEALNQLLADQENLQNAYSYIEQAFIEKFQRVLTAVQNPTEVTREIQEQPGNYAITLPHEKGEN